MTPATGPDPRRSERELVAVVAAHCAAQGYRTYIDPDGSDYFDLVVRRGDEVGLVEAKRSNARAVLQQALRRRVWGDWTAVALPGARAARRLADRTRGSRAAPVGVWLVRGTAVKELRAAVPWAVPGTPDPYAPLRDRFRAVLTSLDRGELPASVAWDAVPSAVRRASRGRGFAEWRLDEPGPGGP
ncbi:MAG TPA: hypothetical protein VMG81_00220 [Thermoplasmata archaeon]|nr:hypothetical protein [Thermoplasmata archaeon]